MYNVDVANCQLASQQNGLRIKTYQGGKGAVWNVRYNNMTLSNVANPIYITQVGGGRKHHWPHATTIVKQAPQQNSCNRASSFEESLLSEAH